MSQARYAIVSPVRNEAEFLPLTIASVASQTTRPCRWVIVDDGSTDNTPEIIKAAANRHAWIEGIFRSDRGTRSAGTGVMEAFHDGYSRLGNESWEFVVKLDGDLSFPPDYFARCLKEFAADAKLGIGGGTCCKRVNGTTVPEFTGEPQFHVRGPSKIYRRACFEAIGGLIKAPGWDTVDLIDANRLGWTTRTFPEIQLTHHRPTGSAYGSWKNWIKNGLANYITGYHPLFMSLKCLRRTFRHPCSLEGVGLMAGFLKGHWKRISRSGKRETVAYLRSQQLNYLTGRDSLWRGR